MTFLRPPRATLNDRDVASALGQAVGLINPILDLLADTDLLGLKARSKNDSRNPAEGVVSGGLDAMAWALDTAAVPGTASWEEMSVDDRVNWWIHRVGALDTLLVAFPGVFGVLVRLLPVQDALGFANQSLVLCAVARECGVIDRRKHVQLLAAVLCDRTLTSDVAVDEPSAEERPTRWTPLVLGSLLWQLAGILRAVGAEIDKRSQPKSYFRYLGMLPGLGAVASYFGEYGALVRAAKEARQWIAAHPVADVQA